jgi:hypothetical protein
MNSVMQEDDVSRRRITVDEYYRMAEVGAIDLSCIFGT